MSFGACANEQFVRPIDEMLSHAVGPSRRPIVIDFLSHNNKWALTNSKPIHRTECHRICVICYFIISFPQFDKCTFVFSRIFNAIIYQSVAKIPATFVALIYSYNKSAFVNFATQSIQILLKSIKNPMFEPKPTE